MKYFTKAAYTNEISSREQHNRKLAYEAALEGIVLLENNNNTLPVTPGPIALFGTGAVFTIKGGTGSGEVNERYSVTIADGLEKAGFTITSSDWLADHKREYELKLNEFKHDMAKKSRTLSLKNLMNAMGEQFLPPFGRKITESDYRNSKTDTAVYVISRQAGEGLDRRLDKGENEPAPQEIEHIKTLTSFYKNTILIINTGSSLDLSSLDEISGLGAVVYFCQQGMEGGNALAAILTGSTSPSGRLTSTWPMKYEDIPFAGEYSYLNGELDDEFYREGIYVGYRYFDTFAVKPRYCFGHGLSYTTTKFELADIDNENSVISMAVKVSNTGTCGSREVVQIYVSCPDGKMRREYQHLAAYGKTSALEPSAAETLHLSFDLRDLAAYDENRAIYLLEQGDYIIRLGHSSADSKIAAVIRLEHDIVVSEHKNILPVKASFDQLQSGEASATADIGAVEDRFVIKIDSDDFETAEHVYPKPSIYHDEQVDTIMNRLTIRDMIDVVVGAGMFFSKNRIDVPGSVGNTTSKLYKKGLINTALCDGPAGLRLSQESGLMKAGNTKPYAMPLSFFETFPKIIKKLMTADRKKTTPVYQYATAFPVGTALAQSWNTNLLERVGQAVGTEMQEYGVTFWLAPALNIQRNPLCGRNFEYFSEDPLISGKSAAAIVRGVQSFPGTYATIKHYLCNNQEDNRNHVSSNVYERPLREIYLKGFRIAVEESAAAAVMTSYNRVNGVYAPESYDACTDVLRNEWGFDGVVMTDWMSTGKNKASSAKAIAAGNDLLMAGTSYDRKDIKKAVKSGLLDIDDLRRCCANVVRSIVYSNIASEVKAEMFEL